ncbi:uncharacterized protein [Clytia hemisphaerica]|uniref:uncharacterized protein n=1 Tax=Clytia hemisphaerica TaxID=252671 RepID=UPI0034D66380|eukprot:TCONS_00051048-protein
MLLDEVEGTNQLVESCRIYLASEVFITELKVLAFFNRHVTFPFLNCIENSSQDDLLNILPQLHKELLQQKTDTLKQFIVSIHGMSEPLMSNDLEKQIIGRMCLSAAGAVHRQCGREYGFSSEPFRATDLSKLTIDQRKDLPTNNCISERDLSRFDEEAVVARSRNRRFKAKNIRNNMVLYKSQKKEIKINHMAKRINQILVGMEVSWNEKQK